MSLVRWDQFSDIDKLFHRMLPTNLSSWPRTTFEQNGGKPVQWAPSVDISETDKEYLIKAELPAVKKEDVKVTVDEGVITIKGERKQEKEEKTEKYHRTETLYGSFERSFALPDDVNADAISCESKDGVLTVHMPKTAAKKSAPKQISVQ